MAPRQNYPVGRGSKMGGGTEEQAGNARRIYGRRKKSMITAAMQKECFVASPALLGGASALTCSGITHRGSEANGDATRVAGASSSSMRLADQKLANPAI